MEVGRFWRLWSDPASNTSPLDQWNGGKGVFEEGQKGALWPSPVRSALAISPYPTPFQSSPSSSTQSPSLNPTFLLPRHPISLLDLTQTLTTWEMLLLLCHSLLLIFAQQVRRALPFHLFFPQTADKTTLDAIQKLLYINPEESSQLGYLTASEYQNTPFRIDCLIVLFVCRL